MVVVAVGVAVAVGVGVGVGVAVVVGVGVGVVVVVERYMSLQDTAQKLETVLDLLPELEEAYKDALMNEADASFAYKDKWPREHKKAAGTIPDRKADADIACAEELKSQLKAEAEAKIAKARLEDWRAVVSARQSILNSQVRTGRIFGE